MWDLFVAAMSDAFVLARRPQFPFRRMLACFSNLRNYFRHLSDFRFFGVILFLFHTLAAAVLSGPVVIFVPCVLVLAPVVVGVVVVCVVVLGGGGGGHCDVCVDQLIHGFSCPSWFFTASSVHMS